MEEVPVRNSESRALHARRIGTIGDAADRYDTDVAHIWELISLERHIIAPDGIPVRLVAPPDEREDGTRWIVSEVPA
jgi:hypothetical protein